MTIKKPSAKYALQLFIFSLVILITGTLLFSSFLKDYYLSIYPFTFGFFIVLSYITHLYLIIKIKKKPNKFVRYFLATTGLKFFLYIIFIGTIVLTAKDQAVR
ncbi:hypothetical protein ACFLSI_04585, partial [Bacteroidota bacterium]